MILIACQMAHTDDDYEEEYTVMKVQLGMFGDIKKWQRQIEKVSELFDTDEEESLHYILQGAALHAAKHAI